MKQPSQTARPISAAEPRVGRANVPIWLIILLLLMFYWGMVYFDLHGGWFEPQVYGPYRSMEEVAGMQPPPPGEGPRLIALGKKLFNANCAVCHMENGAGN